MISVKEYCHTGLSLPSIGRLCHCYQDDDDEGRRGGTRSVARRLWTKARIVQAEKNSNDLIVIDKEVSVTNIPPFSEYAIFTLLLCAVHCKTSFGTLPRRMGRSIGSIFIPLAL